MLLRSPCFCNFLRVLSPSDLDYHSPRKKRLRLVESLCLRTREAMVLCMTHGGGERGTLFKPQWNMFSVHHMVLLSNASPANRSRTTLGLMFQ